MESPYVRRYLCLDALSPAAVRCTPSPFLVSGAVIGCSGPCTHPHHLTHTHTTTALHCLAVLTSADLEARSVRRTPGAYYELQQRCARPSPDGSVEGRVPWTRRRRSGHCYHRDLQPSAALIGPVTEKRCESATWPRLCRRREAAACGGCALATTAAGADRGLSQCVHGRRALLHAAVQRRPLRRLGWRPGRSGRT